MANGNALSELYSYNTADDEVKWKNVIEKQYCPFISRKCLKNRKSDAKQSIGSCSIQYGKESDTIIVCPFRFLERNKIFFDSIHLLRLHEPGNELHVINEFSIPGGNVDYILASARDGKVKDFVGIEMQALDTTKTVWPSRQKLLHKFGVKVLKSDRESTDTFGVNWKMTAKTILVQLHHKILTFESLHKHLLLVVQDKMMDYMTSQFDFSSLHDTLNGDSMHFHMYEMSKKGHKFQLVLKNRKSTDADGIAKCLGLQANPQVELNIILETLTKSISEKTILKF
ncbi:MAG TPA: NotI family restriction endonuclease [bacterium]|nr:NotI family restriction endonuclease [bacterium]